MIAHHAGEYAPKELRLDAVIGAPRSPAPRRRTGPPLLKPHRSPRSLKTSP